MPQSVIPVTTAPSSSPPHTLPRRRIVGLPHNRLRATSAAGPDSLGLSSATAPPASQEAVAIMAYKPTPQACQGLLDFRPRRLGLWSHCLRQTPGLSSD